MCILMLVFLMRDNYFLNNFLQWYITVRYECENNKVLKCLKNIVRYLLTELEALIKY